LRWRQHMGATIWIVAKMRRQLTKELPVRTLRQRWLRVFGEIGSPVNVRSHHPTSRPATQGEDATCVQALCNNGAFAGVMVARCAAGR